MKVIKSQDENFLYLTCGCVVSKKGPLHMCVLKECGCKECHQTAILAGGGDTH